jgi:7,8-dihydroneopterin aldolase/epimerase/oxygenase
MIGTTGLHNLRIDCIVGVYEHERIEAQPIFVDVQVDYDFAEAARSDAIEHAVDYGGIASMVTELAKARRFQLLETMAEEMAALLLGRLPMIERVGLEIRKPDAIPAAANSFVRVERRRS